MLESDMLNRLTVIIPTYGRSDKILQSIYSCLHPKIAIIIIDDNGLNSNNQISTKNLIDSITTDYTSNLSYHALDVNSGACIARNKGIELAKTAVVTFLDDDDILLAEDTLQKLEFFENQNDYDICCSDMFSKFNGKTYQLPFCYFRGLTPTDLLLDGNCYTPMIMAKRDALLRIGGFDNCKKFQDHVIMLKIHLYKLNVCYFDKPSFIHVDHDEYRISNNACSYQTVKLRFKYEFLLLNEIELVGKEFIDLRNVITERKKFLCFYFIVMPRLNTFVKRYLGTRKFFNKIGNNHNCIYVFMKSLFYALKTINGFPFVIKRIAYKIKGMR
ncbi:glycosyltransferase family 2 protein [Shewanella frigidimarina]|uniref:glycosyltransferase family 2 protein n=1 Tax=Shewanella frigidimarina TaxID=56812 RepID=UPI003D7B03B9